MKHYFSLLFFVIISINVFSQEIQYNKKGKVKSVKFHQLDDKSNIPDNSQEFINKFFKVNDNYQFKKKNGGYNHGQLKNETYQQYYKGLKVESANYSFHYRNDTLLYANGNFIEIDSIDIVPNISPIEARDAFAQYKKIPVDLITNHTHELLIKEIPIYENDSITILRLVYKIGLDANSSNNNEIGYINAKNGEILLTNRFADIAYTGTFYTMYSDIQYAKTMRENALEYILKDNSRGTIIHTKNLGNNTNTNSANEISDEDNTWTTLEHEANNVKMALDVHWALQEIYDYFHNYEIESFDNYYFDINAFIKYGSGNNKDNAFWHPTFHYLAFGEGYDYFNPIASLDAIAHEYGHAISDLKLGMTYDERTITAVLQEGISDIWGVILENAIHPNNIWMLGEQITKTYLCTRNISNPTDPNALTQLITTYNSSSYNSSTDDYEKSGVMSYWFYLLVNGGAGSNELGKDYYLGGVGIDEASSFFTKTIFGNFLTGDWTYEGMREAFVQSAIVNGYSNYFKNSS